MVRGGWFAMMISVEEEMSDVGRYQARSRREIFEINDRTMVPWSGKPRWL
jgi:hypothetical protein